MGKLTNTGRVQRGIDFKRNRGSIWVGLGRTTPWSDEDLPPDEDVDANEVEELFVMKLIDEVSFVAEDEDGPIYFKDVRYKRISDQEAFDTGTASLYLRFELLPHEKPNINYRQVGVFVDSIPLEGFSDYRLLDASKFKDLGRLVYLSNQKVQSRYTNTRHVIEVIIPG